MSRNIIRILLGNGDVNKNKINSHQKEGPQLVWGPGSSLTFLWGSKWSNLPPLGVDYSL